ncbi:MAG: helix-turn-helix domain-containing protein [Hyphomicrobiaceae bacterium]|nr:helix-turn-helix domain-containing protein [Hyphomicrobiaceae bacterium]
MEPLLIGVQTTPERDISLEALANEYGLSPSHFQRVFTEAVGESPRAHVERLRLERAAWRLFISDEPIIDIAFDVGFRSPETFSRAFKRKFGKTPSDYRKSMIRRTGEQPEIGPLDQQLGCRLSEVTFLTLKPMNCIGLRRFGPYSDYSNLPPFGPTNQHYPRILERLETRNIAHRKLAITIPYDNPLITPDHLQQADACLQILEEAPADREFRRVDLPGGLYAAIEHRGPYETLIHGYTAVGMRMSNSTRYRLRPAPPLQFFRETSPDGDPMKHLTEIYFPVEKVQ